MATCSHCDGDGYNKNAECPKCHGKGEVWESDIFDVLDLSNLGNGRWETCNHCNGSGYRECKYCEGTGKV